MRKIKIYYAQGAILQVKVSEGVIAELKGSLDPNLHGWMGQQTADGKAIGTITFDRWVFSVEGIVAIEEL